MAFHRGRGCRRRGRSRALRRSLRGALYNLAFIYAGAKKDQCGACRDWYEAHAETLDAEKFLYYVDRFLVEDKGHSGSAMAGLLPMADRLGVADGLLAAFRRARDRAAEVVRDGERRLERAAADQKGKEKARLDRRKHRLANIEHLIGRLRERTPE